MVIVRNAISLLRRDKISPLKSWRSLIMPKINEKRICAVGVLFSSETQSALILRRSMAISQSAFWWENVQLRGMRVGRHRTLIVEPLSSHSMFDYHAHRSQGRLLVIAYDS